MDKQTEQVIVKMYQKRRSLKRIKQATGIPEKQIKQWLIENNLYTGHAPRQYYVNEFFFDKIDTEEKAYWLGFIYADGYLSSKNKEIGIELKNNDIGHLYKFKAALQAEQSVKTYNKKSTFGQQLNCRFSFASTHMYKILLSYYKNIDKTNYGVFPKLANTNLIPHLIRGFFDGDGSLSGRPKKKELLFCPSVSFIGTRETLQYIEKISNFSWTWSQRFPERKTNNYQINCGRVKDCLSFLHFMYDNASIYLDRKYNLYQELLTNREHYARKPE